MTNALTLGHSFNAGDLITVLPGLNHIYQKTGQKTKIFQRLDLPADYSHSNNHPILSEAGVQVSMNQIVFDMLKPLIEAQDYVESFEVWKGQSVDFNIDQTRLHGQVPLPGGVIHQWASLIFPQLECDLSKPWLTTKEVLHNDRYYVNFTERYRNPYITYFFLQEHQDKITFIGLPKEHELFCKQWELDIAYQPVGDFLEMTSLIVGSRGFLGCQSFCWHLADAMKVPRILEVCSAFPNSFPTGANGNSFITQNALEYQFKKLINQ